MNALYAAAATWPRKAIEFDRAWLAVAAVFIGIAVLDPAQVRPSAAFAVGSWPEFCRSSCFPWPSPPMPRRAAPTI